MRTETLVIASVLLASLPMLAIAQDAPSFDCSAATSSAEKLVCADADLAALDRRLAERFYAALAVCGERALTTTLFDTELPGIRIESGDTVDIGAAAGPDAPNTFYLRDLGSFTLTRTGANLTDPYGNVVAYRPLE